MAKLVRDEIPRIVPGKYVVVNQDEKCELLRIKLLEESIEFFRSGSVEELVDVYEVLRALAKCFGLSIDRLETLADAKRFLRGGFEYGYVALD